jgi:alcohol dehydrogenase class IV
MITVSVELRKFIAPEFIIGAGARLLASMAFSNAFPGAVHALRSIRESLGVTTRLSDLGVTKNDLHLACSESDTRPVSCDKPEKNDC